MPTKRQSRQKYPLPKRFSLTFKRKKKKKILIPASQFGRIWRHWAHSQAEEPSAGPDSLQVPLLAILCHFCKRKLYYKTAHRLLQRHLIYCWKLFSFSHLQNLQKGRLLRGFKLCSKNWWSVGLAQMLQLCGWVEAEEPTREGPNRCTDAEEHREQVATMIK